MEILIGLMIVNVLVLGGNFCLLLVGGLPSKSKKEFSPVKMGSRTYSVERFAVGISTSTLGLTWLVAWIYFMTTRWDQFMAQAGALWPHVTLQLFASLGLIVAGYAIFKQWRRYKGIFLTSMGLLVGSLIIAMSMYGPQGHGSMTFMFLLGAWTLVIGGVFTTATFLLDRLVHELDEESFA